MLNLLLPPPLALGTKAMDAALRLGSGPQRRRGSPRLGDGVSGSPSRFSPVASRPGLRRPHTGRQPCGYLEIKGRGISDLNVVGQSDLLIVGPGVLGRIVAEKWQKEHPSCKVYGQTASKNHHSELTDLGIIPSLKGTAIDQKVPHVIFCAPPSGSDDYPGDIRKCMQIGSINLEW